MVATNEHGTPGWYLLRRMDLGREEGESEAAMLPDATYLRLNRAVADRTRGSILGLPRFAAGSRSR